MTTQQKERRLSDIRYKIRALGEGRPENHFSFGIRHDALVKLEAIMALSIHRLDAESAERQPSSAV